MFAECRMQIPLTDPPDWTPIGLLSLEDEIDPDEPAPYPCPLCGGAACVVPAEGIVRQILGPCEPRDPGYRAVRVRYTRAEGMIVMLCQAPDCWVVFAVPVEGVAVPGEGKTY